MLNLKLILLEILNFSTRNVYIVFWCQLFTDSIELETCVFSNKAFLSGPAASPPALCLPTYSLMTIFQAALFSTNGTPWNKELCLSKQCDSKHPPSLDRHPGVIGALLLDWPSGLPRTKQVFVSEMAAISDWSQAEGLFWTCAGATRARREWMGESGDLSDPQGPGAGGRERESQKVRDN